MLLVFVGCPSKCEASTIVEISVINNVIPIRTVKTTNLLATESVPLGPHILIMSTELNIQSQTYLRASDLHNLSLVKCNLLIR